MDLRTEPNASLPRLAPSLSGNSQLIGFDFGTKRIGLAVGNRITQTAQPLATVVGDHDARWRRIDQIIQEWGPDALVIGVPYYPDGVAHANTRRARAFGQALKSRYRLSIFEVDERYTTVEAHSMGAKDADAMAACLILEQFLRSGRE